MSLVHFILNCSRIVWVLGTSGMFIYSNVGIVQQFPDCLCNIFIHIKGDSYVKKYLKLSDCRLIYWQHHHSFPFIKHTGRYVSYFKHESPYYGMPWDLATLFDYPYTSLGENIGRNIPSPEAAVKACMASPSHRENISRENYTNTGVAIAVDAKGIYYWVQLFSSQ